MTFCFILRWLWKSVRLGWVNAPNLCFLFYVERYSSFAYLPWYTLFPPPPPNFAYSRPKRNWKQCLCTILGGKQYVFCKICKWQIPIWCVGVPCLFNVFFPVSSEKTRGFSNWNRWVLPVHTNERPLETTLSLKPFFPCSILRYSIRKTKGDAAYRKVQGYPWTLKTSLILINFISVKISTHLDLMLGH